MAYMLLLSLDTAVFGVLFCLSTAYLVSFLKSGLPFDRTEKARPKKVFPPGPRPWPIVGNLLFFKKMMKNADEELMKVAHKYGGLCMLWFSFNPILIISKAADVKQLLDKRGSVYSDRPTQSSFREQAWPWRLVTTGVGEQFRVLRRVYNNLLGPQQSASFNKYQDYEAKIMLRDLLTMPEGFLAHTERFAISVIFSAVYGVRLVQLDHPTMIEFYHVWEDMLRYFQPGTLPLDYFPILEKLPKCLQPWLKLATTLRSRESALHIAFLRTLKKQVEAGEEPQCFGSELVKIQERADTTSSVLQSFFKVMAMNPDAVQAAHTELDQVVGPSRLPTWEDEPNLPYLRALIKEVHRWAPIGSLGIPHATTYSDTYHNQSIPKGTIVFPNLTYLNRDPERYQDPDAFKPERFLGDDLHASASANHLDFYRRDHFHYGFGRRLCQGIFVAEASLFIVISRVLWAFNISAEDGAPPLDLNDKIAGLVTKPKPYCVQIKPRSAAAKKVIEESANLAQTDILDFDSVELLM